LVILDFIQIGQVEHRSCLLLLRLLLTVALLLLGAVASHHYALVRVKLA